MTHPVLRSTRFITQPSFLFACRVDRDSALSPTPMVGVATTLATGMGGLGLLAAAKRAATTGIPSMRITADSLYQKRVTMRKTARQLTGRKRRGDVLHIFQSVDVRRLSRTKSPTVNLWNSSLTSRNLNATPYLAGNPALPRLPVSGLPASYALATQMLLASSAIGNHYRDVVLLLTSVEQPNFIDNRRQ